MVVLVTLHQLLAHLQLTLVEAAAAATPLVARAALEAAVMVREVLPEQELLAQQTQVEAVVLEAQILGRLATMENPAAPALLSSS
jgi:hypothetical protein